MEEKQNNYTTHISRSLSVPVLLNTNSNSMIQLQRHNSEIITHFTERSLQLHNVIRKLNTSIPIDSHLLKEFEHELINFHTLSINEIAIYFEVDIHQGRNKEEVKQLLLVFGNNELPKHKDYPLWIKFIICFFTGFSWVLWIAMILAFISYRPLGVPPTDTYNLSLAIAILLIIIVCGFFNFYQVLKSARILSTFSVYIPSNCIVIRNGETLSINALELVIGDIILLETGNKVPTDCRIIQSNDLKIDKSMLTGENEPITLISDTELSTISLLQSHNIAFMGSNIASGNGIGLVIATGKKNQLAKIATQVNDNKVVLTSLQKELNRFVVLIVTLALLTVLIVILVWIFFLNIKHKGFLSVTGLIANVIAVVVAFIPEGLPIAMETGLSLIAYRLCHLHKVLVKNLSIIETVGSMTFLATDKTGTLTQNIMTVTEIISCCNIYDITIHVNLTKADIFHDIMLVAVLCNESKLEVIKDQEDINICKAIGSNGIDKALLNWAQTNHMVDNIQRDYHIIDTISFNSSTKIAMSIIQKYDNIDFIIIIIKGAPEYVLRQCTSYIDETYGEIRPLDDKGKAQLMQNIASISQLGKRVIALAKSNYIQYNKTKFEDRAASSKAKKYPVKDMIFISCIAVSDPPRDGVYDTIKQLRGAGIKIAMVTGDSLPTAMSIGHQVGILSQLNPIHEYDTLHQFNEYEELNHGNLKEIMDKYMLENKSQDVEEQNMQLYNSSSILIDGHDLDHISTYGWNYIFSHDEMIFSRTTPDQKLMIVRESQIRGHRTGVTGDGVNDSPALKNADVGISMGLSGTAVARDASSIVLLDDNFNSILKAVEEGRLIFANLRKVIAYQMSAGSWAELLPVLATFFLGMPQPLSSFLMIVISAITDVFAGLALINEPPEKVILTEKPRNIKTCRLVDWKIILYSFLFYGNMEAIGAFLNYFLYMYERGPVNRIANPIPIDDDGTVKFPIGYLPKQLIGAWNWGLNSNNLGDDEIKAAATGSSVFFVTLVVCQMGHLLAIRRKTPYFSDSLKNFQSIDGNLIQRMWQEVSFEKRIIFAWIGSILVANFFNEIPQVQIHVGAGSVPGRYWGIAIGWSILIFMINEMRKWIVFLYPKSFISKIAW